jgi:hypothetical protein
MPDTAALARELFRAYRDDRLRVPAPSTRDSAYAVEAAIAQMQAARRGRPVGVKVGYANKAMWRVLKVDTLMWAHMYHDTVYSVSSMELALPSYRRASKIEPGIVFRMKRPLEPDADAAAEASTDWRSASKSFDFPVTEPPFKPADFAAAYGLLLALELLRMTPQIIPEMVDALAKSNVRLSKNGEFGEEGSGRNSLRSRRRDATPLGGSDFVSSGTLTSGIPVEKGELWSAEVEGLPLSSLSLRLS